MALRTAIPASASVTLTIAASRAVSSSPSDRASAMSRTSRLSWRTTLAVQNFAVAVCAAVRCVLVFWPTALISLKPATHSALESDGGGGGRKRSALGRTNGFMVPAHGVCGGA